jgi:hypothetical protein
MTDINELYQLAIKHWPCNEHVYPDLQGATDDQKTVFTANHILLHAQTNLGDVARYIENTHHGENPDAQILRKAAWKMILHGLRLGAATGLSAEQLAEEIVDWSKRHPEG